MPWWPSELPAVGGGVFYLIKLVSGYRGVSSRLVEVRPFEKGLREPCIATTMAV